MAKEDQKVNKPCLTPLPVFLTPLPVFRGTGILDNVFDAERGWESRGEDRFFVIFLLSLFAFRFLFDLIADRGHAEPEPVKLIEAGSDNRKIQLLIFYFP